MRKLGVWGIGVALAVGLSTGPVRAGDEDESGDAAKSAPPKAAASRWGGSWFGSQKKPPAKKPEPRSGKEQAAAAPAKKVPTRAEAEAAERAREQANYLRRAEVCLKLMEVAYDTNDDELRRLAEQLEERARRTYAQRVAHLPASGAAFVSDEQTLKKHLGPSTSSLDGKPGDVPPYHVTDKEATARTAVREEKP
jgi:hypothetical protein